MTDLTDPLGRPKHWHIDPRTGKCYDNDGNEIAPAAPTSPVARLSVERRPVRIWIVDRLTRLAATCFRLASRIDCNPRPDLRCDPTGGTTLFGTDGTILTVEPGVAITLSARVDIADTSLDTSRRES